MVARRRPRTVALAPLAAALALLGGCPTAGEPFDAELRIVTADNQDPFDDVERLAITFSYPDGATRCCPARSSTRTAAASTRRRSWS